MKHFLLAMVLLLSGLTPTFAAYESTPALDKKVDKVADAIMDLMTTRSVEYGEKVIKILKAFETRFSVENNERNEYIAYRLRLQIEKFHHCTISEGTWLTVVNECEYVSKERCDDQEGMFYECGSACRHTDSQVCTLQCVFYCAFDFDYDKDGKPDRANRVAETGTGATTMGTGTTTTGNSTQTGTVQ